MTNLFNKVKFIFLMLLCAGCLSDGGSGTSVETLDGIFVDSPVGGLTYTTPSQSGITDADGKFRFNEGEKVTFLIEDVVLGEGLGASQMTPIDLVEGADNENHPEVINISRFLISLDEDGLAENGIWLAVPIRRQVAGRSINFKQSPDNFEKDQVVTALFEDLNSLYLFTDDHERQLCSVEFAKAHLRTNLLSSIEIIPPQGSVPLGAVYQFSATGTYTDGVIGDVTNLVTWSALDPAIASPPDGGAMSGELQSLMVGTTTIQALSGKIKAQAQLTVTPTTMVRIEIAPLNPILPLGMIQQLTATGINSDKTTEDLTQQADWTSSDLSIIEITADGQMTCAGIGGADVMVAYDTISALMPVQVTDAELENIEIMPFNFTLPLGNARQFTATGVYTDQTTHNITAQVAWLSSDTTVAVVSTTADRRGLVTGAGIGTSVLSADMDGVHNETTLTVSDAQLIDIEVTPANSSVPLGSEIQFAANARYTDDSIRNITTQAEWTSSDTSVVKVDNTETQKGLATTQDIGTALIRADYQGLSVFTQLSVTQASLTALEITPLDPKRPAGNVIYFTAKAHYSDASIRDATSLVFWSSSDTGVAVISNSTASKGVATSIQAGETTIKAVDGSISAASILTIKNASLTSIQISPAKPQLPLGKSLQFTAEGVFTDGIKQDITRDTTWISLDENIAAVSNAQGTTGLVTSVGMGITAIQANKDDVSASVEIQVTAAALVSITIEPQDQRLPLGGRATLAAIGAYSDGSSLDISSEVVWESMNEFVVSVNNKGQIQGVGIGAAMIKAMVEDISVETEVVVIDAELVSITITPIDISLSAGAAKQFAAQGLYTDTSTSNLTNQVIWDSSDKTVAVVSNAEGAKGLITAAGPGACTISAAYQGISATARLTVK